VNDTPSAWVLEHTRTAHRLALEDAQADERLARQLAALASPWDPDETPDKVCACGSIISPLSDKDTCKTCRNREADRKYRASGQKQTRENQRRAAKRERRGVEW